MPDQNNIVSIETANPVIVYKPSEILNIFATYISQQGVNRKIVYLRGIYLKSQSHNPQWQFRYDSLRDENNQSEITLQIPPRLCENLKDGNLVTVRGVLDRKMLAKQGHIQIMLIVSEIDIIQDQAIDEEEIKRMEVRRQKAQRGFQNVDSIVEQILYTDQRPRIALVFATTSITMTDFNAGVQAAKSAIDFTEFRVNFSNTNELCQHLRNIDKQKFTAIALVRGGGGGIEHLDDLAALQTVSAMQTPVIAAIGHPDERLFIKEIADKEVAVPNALGHYFADMVEEVNEKKSRSRAVLTEQIKKQFREQIESGQKQNKALQEKLAALTKTQEEGNKKHNEQMVAAQKQNEDLRKQLASIQKSSDQRSKELNESLAKLQKTNSELQRSLSQLTAQNTQTARDLNAAKDRARELQKQLDELQNKKKGCFGVIIGAIAITATVFASIILVLF